MGAAVFTGDRLKAASLANRLRHQFESPGAWNSDETPRSAFCSEGRQQKGLVAYVEPCDEWKARAADLGIYRSGF